MKVLLLWDSSSSSTWDVGHFVSRALRRLGVKVANFVYAQEIVLQNLAINAFRGTQDVSYDGEAVLLANRLMLGYIASSDCDAIISVCSLDVYKSAWTWIAGLRRNLKKPPKVVFLYTESPYRPAEELENARWADYIFCNERSFVPRLRAFQPRTWYLPQAYDDQWHVPAQREPRYGVYFCGSGFRNRVETLEQVDWAATGTTLTLKGLWPDIEPGTPLYPYYEKGLVPNERTVDDYRASQICLNVHRQEGEIVVFERDVPERSYMRERRPFRVRDAWSMNNRTLEIAASGGFQITDNTRDEVGEVFGASVPRYTDAAHLQELVTYYAQRPDERARMAAEARLRIEGRTYLANMKRVLNLIGG